VYLLLSLLTITRHLLAVSSSGRPGSALYLSTIKVEEVCGLTRIQPQVRPPVPFFDVPFVHFHLFSGLYSPSILMERSIYWYLMELVEYCLEILFRLHLQGVALQALSASLPQPTVDTLLIRQVIALQWSFHPVVLLAIALQLSLHLGSSLATALHFFALLFADPWKIFLFVVLPTIVGLTTHPLMVNLHSSFHPGNFLEIAFEFHTLLLVVLSLTAGLTKQPQMVGLD
jgi:hypothetical protein